MRIFGLLVAFFLIPQSAFGQVCTDPTVDCDTGGGITLTFVCKDQTGGYISGFDISIEVTVACCVVAGPFQGVTGNSGTVTFYDLPAGALLGEMDFFFNVNGKRTLFQGLPRKALKSNAICTTTWDLSQAPPRDGWVSISWSGGSEEVSLRPRHRMLRASHRRRC